MTKRAIEATGLYKAFKTGRTKLEVLKRIDFDALHGEVTMVMGPSGSGKSTLMHILAGLDRPDGGTVTIDGTEITALGDDARTKLRRSHIGLIFQFFNLVPMLTAR